jgi:hypothetical protein
MEGSRGDGEPVALQSRQLNIVFGGRLGGLPSPVECTGRHCSTERMIDGHL